ncbi:MAG TPA: metallophosphoesterase family protein [Acetobacteraceae bacterium]|nr:metallophosphoesterase family protein [Acetobacteraceae bacterium]
MLDFVPAPARLPSNMRVYAVGDVHGCLDRLIAIHSDIAADLAERPVAEPLLIHMGDYVDRGTDSAGVVALLAGADHPLSGRVVNLMGNHEDLLLSAVERHSAESAQLWLINGGANSLHSWGIPRTTPPAEWADRVPPEHLSFVRGLALSHAAGGYVFVHAGVRPGSPLGQQSRHDLLWIREPFLSSATDFGAVIVHGHTPRLRPELRRNRIGIDTGAVMGGALTCAVLEADRVAFLSR